MLSSRLANWIRKWPWASPSSKSKAGSIWPRPASAPRSLSPEDRVNRAHRAQELLSNDLLADAIHATERDIIEQIKDVKLADTEAHTRLVLALQTNNAVSRQLWRLIQDGHEAQSRINLRGKRID